MEFQLLQTLLVLSLLVFLLIKLLRWWWWWCDCDVCCAYLSSSWRAEHRNLSDWYTQLLGRSPTKSVQVHVLGNAIITANPENVEYILKTRFHNFPKGKPFSDILGDFLGRGILNVDGSHWLFQRRLASRELDSASVRSFAVGVVVEEIRCRLIPLLAHSNGAVLDLQDVFRRISFNCICKYSFGLDPECAAGLPVSPADFEVAFDTASRLSAERALHVFPFLWKLKRALNLGSEKRLQRSLHVIDSVARHLILHRRRHPHLMTTSPDLLSHFMSSISEDDEYLRDIVVSFLLAGRDSVASGLTGFFLLLSTHPGVEVNILEEVDNVLGREAVFDFDFVQLPRLHYLQAAVHESMRLYPPVQFDSKFSVEEDVLPDGMAVGRGSRVTYHTYAMGRMEEIWGEDCLEFKPERWLNTQGRFCRESAYKYPVFQAGVRVCLGKEMALLEMKAVILSILPRFHVRPIAGGGGGPMFSPGLTATFTGGLRVVVHPRI